MDNMQENMSCTPACYTVYFVCFGNVFLYENIILVMLLVVSCAPMSSILTA